MNAEDLITKEEETMQMFQPMYDIESAIGGLKCLEVRHQVASIEWMVAKLLDYRSSVLLGLLDTEDKTK